MFTKRDFMWDENLEKSKNFNYHRVNCRHEKTLENGKY